jgi:soluble lytic murein transglycosylase
MRRNAEKMLRADGESPQTVISFFRKYPPQTATAWLRYAEALQRQGQSAEATTAARNSWTSGALTPDDESRVLSGFAGALRPEDHDARMDRLLWSRAVVPAARQLAMTTAGRRQVFETRLAMLSKAPDAASRIAAAGSAVRSDPGFVSDYAWWLRNTGQAAAVRNLLAEPRALTSYPLAPAGWLETRRTNARDAASDGQWSLAFNIASRADDAYAPGTIVRDRPFAERDIYTDLVWLAGNTALTKLGRPADAQRMFERYAAAAKSPQTRAKGLYWAGRAADAAGKRPEATAYYEQAAQFFDQFHGQLATERLGRAPQVLSTPRTVEVSSAERQAFNDRSVVQALVALGQQGNWQDQTQFIRALAGSVTTDIDHVLASELADKVRRVDLKVLVGRSARNFGLSDYVISAFPQMPVPSEHLSDWTMIHAITRQESQFDRQATSPVGAKGLMQLMPGTARQTAPSAGLSYNYGSLIDPQYNVALGSTYFGQLMTQYGGSYVLSVAAYNAGPGNVNKWLRANGDPRNRIDVLTWIEAIPLSETRNYVQRVLENAVVYGMLNPARAAVKTSTPLSTYLGKRQPG